MWSRTRPWRRFTPPRTWCRTRTRCRCWAALRTVSTAADQGWLAAPDNHFAASPDSGVTGSGTGCVCGARSRPCIRAWIIFAASGEIHRAGVGALHATPDDHFSAGPDCRVTTSGFGRVGSASRCPALCAWIVSRAVTEYVPSVVATPDDHFTVSPDCGMRRAWFGGVGEADSHPTIRARIVCTAGVQRIEIPKPTRLSFYYQSRQRCDCIGHQVR